MNGARGAPPQASKQLWVAVQVLILRLARAGEDLDVSCYRRDRPKAQRRHELQLEEALVACVQRHHRREALRQARSPRRHRRGGGRSGCRRSRSGALRRWLLCRRCRGIPGRREVAAERIAEEARAGLPRRRRVPAGGVRSGHGALERGDSAATVVAEPQRGHRGVAAHGERLPPHNAQSLPVTEHVRLHSRHHTPHTPHTPITHLCDTTHFPMEPSDLATNSVHQLASVPTICVSA